MNLYDRWKRKVKNTSGEKKNFPHATHLKNFTFRASIETIVGGQTVNVNETHKMTSTKCQLPKVVQTSCFCENMILIVRKYIFVFLPQCLTLLIKL